MVYEMAAELVVFQVLKQKSEEGELGFGVAARYEDFLDLKRLLDLDVGEG